VAYLADYCAKMARYASLAAAGRLSRHVSRQNGEIRVLRADCDGDQAHAVGSTPSFDWCAAEVFRG
jgi:hypothetical protein